MKKNSVYLPCVFLALTFAPATAQVGGASQQASPAPVPYASVSQLNMLLSELEQASQAAQADLAKLRIEKWKADGGTKRQTQSNVQSLERNLQSALPEIVGQLRNSPENLTSTFKLYRNLGALERSRRSFAERIENLSGEKEVELSRLRTALQNAQAANAQPPKKVVV